MPFGNVESMERVASARFPTACRSRAVGYGRIVRRRDYLKKSSMAGVGMVVLPGLVRAGAEWKDGLEAVLDPVGPGLKKWASVCTVTRDAAGQPAFDWAHFRDSGSATDFWPASTIKLYAVVAALEFLNERGFSLETIVSFEHREANGCWVLDCARTVREMISETFRRSSNED